MNIMLPPKLVPLQALQLFLEIIAFTILGIRAAIWTHIQWIKYKNIRDTDKKQKIIDASNLKIAEDNRLKETHQQTREIAQVLTNVTPIHRHITRGDGIWEPNKR